jgi:hypothetical protein
LGITVPQLLHLYHAAAAEFVIPHSSFLKLKIKCYEFGVRALFMKSKKKKG